MELSATSEVTRTVIAVAVSVLSNLTVRSIITVATRVTPSPVVSGLVAVSRCIAVMYGRLVQTTISIEGSWLVIVTALVIHIYCRASLVPLVGMGR